VRFRSSRRSCYAARTVASRPVPMRSGWAAASRRSSIRPPHGRPGMRCPEEPVPSPEQRCPDVPGRARARAARAAAPFARESCQYFALRFQALLNLSVLRCTQSIAERTRAAVFCVCDATGRRAAAVATANRLPAT